MGGSVSTGFDYDKQLFADTKPQSVEVKDEKSDAKDCGLPRRSAKYSAKLLRYVDEDAKDGGAKTIWEIFLRGSRGFPKNRMLGTRVFDVDEKKAAAIRAADTGAAPAPAAAVAAPQNAAAPEPSAPTAAAAATDPRSAAAPAPAAAGATPAAAPAATDAKDAKPADIKPAEAKDAKSGDAKGAEKSHKAAAPTKDYGIRLNADKTLKRGEYKFMSYEEVEKEAIDFGAGLVSLGAKPKDSIGIWSINRPEWVVAFLGFHSQSFKTVSLYATLGADAVKYICDHAECEIVIAEKNNLKTFLAIAPALKKLKHIIQIDFDARWNNVHEYVEPADVKAFAAVGVNLHGFSAVRAAGAATKDVQLHPPTPEDLAYIMYTSGTTGVPKGAMLCHGNVVATIATVPHVAVLTDKDVHISYLPLAHIFECIIECAMMTHGGAIGFYNGIAAKLTEDMSMLHPTILCGVPKVFTTFYQKVMGAIAERNCMVQYLFYKTYNAQIDAIRNRQPVDESADKKYFGGIRERMGLTKTRLFITGAAPCRPYIMEFLRCISAGNKGVVVQGYGMTETAAATSITAVDDVNMGHCGPPVPCCEVKLRDIPEMKYLHTDPNPRGEILVRGANVFAGYFKNEQATKETIEEGGWIATGDVGRWNPNGTLSIIDRKKNLFKLSQGEYIAAEKVEGIYQKSQAVGQIWIYGNSTKSSVVAVVVPNVDTLRTWAESQGWWKLAREAWRTGTGYSPAFIAEIDELCSGPHAKAVKAFVFAEMGKLNNELNGLERCKDIIIESKMDERAWGFHEANDTLTPTNKLKRPVLLAKYLKELKALYAANGEATNSNEKWPGEQ